MNSRTRLSTISHTIYTVVICILAFLCTFGLFYDLSHIHVWEDYVGTVVEFLFALLLWCIVFFEIRSFGSKLFIDDNGISIKRFHKTKVNLQWHDICETGIGFIPTPIGSKKRLYLATKHLSDNQKQDLLTLKYETVHFSYLPKGWTKIICEKCNNFDSQDYELLIKWEKSF